MLAPFYIIAFGCVVGLALLALVFVRPHHTLF